MASLEQLVYGCRRNGRNGAGILARSATLMSDCAAEVAAACERWAAPVVFATARPALLSLPLESRLEPLTGPLFLVAATLTGPPAGPALCHALILTEAGYAGFGHNPYAVAMEGAFLRHWRAADGGRLPRLDLKPTSLAPLVSRLPTPGDADSIGEAMRQLLVTRRLLLPLNAPDEESDRFLALLLAALPLARKRSLRFASFAVPAALELDLAAVPGPGSGAGAGPADWRRILLVGDPANPAAADLEHVIEAQKLLRRGDLEGLSRLGRRAGARTPAKRRPTAPARPVRAVALPGRPAPRFSSAIAFRPAPPFRSATGPSRPRRPAHARSGPGSGRRGRLRGVLAVAALLVLAVGVVLGLFRLAGSPERGWDLSGIWRASGL